MPYVAAADLDDLAVSEARGHFSGIAAFDAALVEAGRFTEHVWLAPSPSDAFGELIQLTCRRFPESPYGQAFPTPVPHLTVGQASPAASVDEIARAAEEELVPRLPIAFRVDAAWLLVEQGDGTWVAAERFTFAS
jgi:2'-5' RNA ligase superfamily